MKVYKHNNVCIIAVLIVLIFSSLEFSYADASRDKHLKRTWKIYVPKDIKGKVPLVVDLHMLSGYAGWHDDISGFHNLADKKKFIIIWPQGIQSSWNAGKCCDYAAEHKVDDISFIRNLVNTIMSEYDVDTNRIYVTELSNGCAMAQRLAMDASDLFAAASCVSFYLLSSKNKAYSPIPIMEIPWGERSISSPNPLFSIVSKEKQTIIPSVQPFVLL